MRLIHLPALRHKAAETLSHTAVSVLHPAAWSADVCVLFNAANAPLLIPLRAAGIPTAVHVDGLEWQRSKWGRFGSRYYLAAERLAATLADELIADAVGIQDYYVDRYGATSAHIAYGAPVLEEQPLHLLDTLEIEPRKYHLVVARLEPENNVHIILDAVNLVHLRHELIVVGDAPYGQTYVEGLRDRARGAGRARLIGSVWDQDLLNAAYAGSLTYSHGHSVGGTNPSLLRAMGAGCHVLAYDTVFNREALSTTGQYWATAEELASLLQRAESGIGTQRYGEHARQRIRAHYNWDAVADAYEKLLVALAQR